MTPGTPGLVTQCICKDSRKQEESTRKTRSPRLGCNVCNDSVLLEEKSGQGPGGKV